MLIIKEIRKNLAGTPDDVENANKSAETDRNGSVNSGTDGNNGNAAVEAKGDPPHPKSLMTYAIQIDSGKIKIPPLVDMRIPMTRLSGERSSVAGIFLETVIEKLEFAYGSTEPVMKKGCLSLPQIAALPESARMHILLCLKDLSSLEKALYMKKEKNSFRRIKAVDKGIVKMAKKISKRDSKVAKRKSTLATSSHGNQQVASDLACRRQQILSDVMKLDDAELSELWSVHQRYQKKLAKKRNEE
jgi:hypothetical protein